MRHPVPPIHEDEATLKARLPREQDGHRKPRVQMLSRLVTRPAQDRQDVARRLGLHRHTIGRWGRDAWLAIYVPPRPTRVARAGRAGEPGAGPPSFGGLGLV
jgi:hypothetical protein